MALMKCQGDCANNIVEPVLYDKVRRADLPPLVAAEGLFKAHRDAERDLIQHDRLAQKG
jgi:hypothetical protein